MIKRHFSCSVPLCFQDVWLKTVLLNLLTYAPTWTCQHWLNAITFQKWGKKYRHRKLHVITIIWWTFRNSFRCFQKNKKKPNFEIIKNYFGQTIVKIQGERMLRRTSPFSLVFSHCYKTFFYKSDVLFSLVY